MTRLSLLVAAGVALCSTSLRAQWTENFDSYAANSQAVGQGNWEEWGPGAGALVSNVFANSPANSINIQGATDLVHQYSGYTTGKWVYKTKQYIPSGMVGSTYFILLNTYAYPAGPYNWSVQVEFSVANGIRGNFGTGLVGHNTVPMVTDAWADIQVIIDLDENWVQFYYNGVLFDEPGLPDHPSLGGGYSWTGGVFGGGAGALNIAAVDLYANLATSAFYDDMSLQPATFEILGTGCSGTLPAPALSMILPPIGGQAFVEQIDNLPLNAAVHLFGFGNQSSLLGPLPLDLAGYGAPNCVLRVSPDSTVFLLGANNSASFVVVIPPGLTGLKFYVQAAALDTAANALGVTVSPMGAVWIQ